MPGFADKLMVYGSLPLVKLKEKVAHSPGHSVAVPDKVPEGPGVAVTETISPPGQGPGEVYMTLYVVPPVAPEITPVVGLMVAPPPPGGAKLNIPPGTPVILAAPEVGAQKSLCVKVALWGGLTTTSIVVVEAQGPLVGVKV